LRNLLKHSIETSNPEFELCTCKIKPSGPLRTFESRKCLSAITHNTAAELLRNVRCVGGSHLPKDSGPMYLRLEEPLLSQYIDYRHIFFVRVPDTILTNENGVSHLLPALLKNARSLRMATPLVRICVNEMHSGYEKKWPRPWNVHFNTNICDKSR